MALPVVLCQEVEYIVKIYYLKFLDIGDGAVFLPSLVLTSDKTLLGNEAGSSKPKTRRKSAGNSKASEKQSNRKTKANAKKPKRDNADSKMPQTTEAPALTAKVEN